MALAKDSLQRDLTRCLTTKLENGLGKVGEDGVLQCSNNYGLASGAGGKHK